MSELRLDPGIVLLVDKQRQKVYQYPTGGLGYWHTGLHWYSKGTAELWQGLMVERWAEISPDRASMLC